MFGLSFIFSRELSEYSLSISVDSLDLFLFHLVKI